MPTPTQSELEATRRALVSHGLQFLRSSATFLSTSPSQTTFSILHFAVGLELLLKSRLFQEHWSLIAAAPHSTQWSAIKDGDFQSVQARDLLPVLSRILGENFSPATEAAFKEVLRHRNRSIHFLPKDDLVSTAGDLCKGWYHLVELLRHRWRSSFEDFQEEIERVEKSLLSLRTYLRTRFDHLETSHRFTKAKHDGRLIECFVCGFQSAILDKGQAHVSVGACPVCYSAFLAAHIGCGHWLDLSQGFYGETRCKCGATHTPQDLAELCDELQPRLSPKELATLGSTRFSCGECLQHQTVAERAGTLHCFGCGADFKLEQQTSCGWCNEPWVGYATENTELVGCEFCDGHPEWSSHR